MDSNKQIDRSKLTPEQLDRLDNYNNQMAVIRRLKDLGDMTQEVISLLDSQNKEEADNTKQMAALLHDMRDSLISLNKMEQEDSDKPVLDALAKLEKSITAAVAKIDVKPNVTVAAPDVTVSPAPVDLTAIEKLLKNDIPKAFREAVQAVPQPEKEDYTPLLNAWEGISEQLVSLENATRMKPLPGTMKVTNADGTPITSYEQTYAVRIDNTTTANTTYIGKAVIGSLSSSAVWQIAKLDTSSGLVKTWADGNSQFDNIWDNITLLVYS